LESVLALGLMAAVLSFAVGLHFRLLSSDHSGDRLQAWALTEEILVSRENDIATGARELGKFHIVVGEEPYAPGIVQVVISCSRGERTVLTRRCLLPARP
jgi:hypothetical protein